MKQLYYTFIYIARGKGNNLIKIISLTLGLTVALVLFSKVGFEMSHDKNYPDADRIYRVQRNIYVDNEIDTQRESVYAPVAMDLKADINEIDAAAVTLNNTQEAYFQYGDTWIKERTIYANETIFDVFGIQLVEGSKELLGVEGNLFLSESVARRFWGDEPVVGQTLLQKSKTYTVSGVFKDLPAGHLDFDVLLPIKEMWGNATFGWHNPEAFFAYVKLLPGVSQEEVEAKIKTILPKYMDTEAMLSSGNIQEFYLNPVSGIYMNNSAVKRLVLILSLLAFSLLFIAAMNYVLISVSSLAKRAKTVGVHKCNGASDRSIFTMFINETVVMICLSLVASVLLIFTLREFIEGIIQTSLSSIFTWSNIWISVAVVGGLVVLAGIIPAFIFSSVPVTHLFRAYATDKKHWKRSLLFVQFTGVAFVVTLLFIIVKQYNLLMVNEPGYTTKNVVYSENINDLPREEVARLKMELARMPEVAHVSVSSNLPLDFLNGVFATSADDSELTFSARCFAADSDFLETLQIKLLAGNNVGDNSYNYTRALVNETFARSMGWTDSPAGKTFNMKLLGNESVNVIGLVNDFQLYTLYEHDVVDPVSPLIIFPLEQSEANWLFGWNRVILRLHTMNDEVLSHINNRVKQITNKSNAFFVSYDSRIKSSYDDTLLYRDSILSAAVVLLFIAILGLFGFTDDEVSRRSKEIAIRKIIGATARDVLFTISRNIVLIAIPAILMGLAVSYLIGIDWLRQFAVKIPLTIYLFTFSGIIVLSSIIVCIVTRTWTVANENPVNSIKNE